MIDQATRTPAPCAVVDCPNPGRPQVCPYDGRYHHHGRIHYDNGHPAHPGLVFRAIESAGWQYVCDDHLDEIERGLAELRARRSAERATSASGSWDDVVCPCGNAPHLDGFFTSDIAGTYATPYALADGADPTPVWEGSIVTCYSCGRIHDQRADGRILGTVDVDDLMVAAEADLADQDRHITATTGRSTSERLAKAREIAERGAR